MGLLAHSKISGSRHGALQVPCVTLLNPSVHCSIKEEQQKEQMDKQWQFNTMQRKSKWGRESGAVCSSSTIPPWLKKWGRTWSIHSRKKQQSRWLIKHSLKVKNIVGKKESKNVACREGLRQRRELPASQTYTLHFLNCLRQSQL